MSHGWGSNVLVEILRALLGVTPAAAGYATFTVAPPPAGLDAASGTIPSPAGTIAVSWRRDPHGTFAMDLTVPPNTTATVRLPAASVTAISEHGQPLATSSGISGVSSIGRVTVLHAGAGTYHFAVAR